MRKTYDLRIPFDAAVRAFKQALGLPSNNRSDFLRDIRTTFRLQLEQVISDTGIALPPIGDTPPRLTKNARVIAFSPIKKMTGWKNEIPVEIDSTFAVKYGSDDYSLQGLNYLDRAACELPSLRPFLEIPDFSLGNLTFHAPNEDCDINVVGDEGIRLIGVAIEASRKKRSSYFILLGVHFDRKLLVDRLQTNVPCDHKSELLDEIRIGTLHYPVTFICRYCGQLLTCKCFEGTYKIRDDILRHLPYGNSEKSLAIAAEGILSRAGICSLCTGRVPRHVYGHAMYYSTFLQRYLPYQVLFARRRLGRNVYEGDPEYRETENETRRAFGYMEIGQKWLNETFLYKLVSTLFAPVEVVQHYRGKELEGLELDIWVPSCQLGIEYQGEQHYRVLEHWGGQAGLERRLFNDMKKKAICTRLGYTLIEFHHSQPISEDTVRKRLASFVTLNAELPSRGT